MVPQQIHNRVDEALLSRLDRRVSKLGKHYERFRITIAANLGQLVERLEQNSLRDDVELWNLATSPGEQMRIVRAIGIDRQEKLALMATYYSLQFLHMNLMALDRLELSLSDGEGRTDAFAHFLDSQGTNYQRLNAVYIDNLLGLFLENKEHPEFCICVVGTRSDQDDVDIMVVHAEELLDAETENSSQLLQGVENLNRAMGKVMAEFFKRAGRLHLYIAERMGMTGYTASVDDYSAALKKDLTDFVMFCELLSAEPLLGSWNILSEFKRRVTDRFYGKKSKWRRFYVGFLRGLLGEMHSLLVQDLSRDRIEFKTDALRLVKGMALAGKVVHDIREVQPVAVIDELAVEMPRLQEDFATLRKAFLFVETFRLLFHMLGVQEEEVDFAQDHEPVLREVAYVMGFTEKGGVSVANQLVVRYFESVEKIRTTCRKLMDVLTRHVRKASVYSLLTRRKPLVSKNVARELADSVRIFSGHIFFEDVLAALKEKDGRLAARFVQDIARLTERTRNKVVDSFLEFSSSDPMTLMDLILTIRGVEGEDAAALFDSLVNGFLDRMEQGADVLPGLLSVFSTEPALVNSFIETLKRPQRTRLEDSLDTELWDEEQKETLRRLRKYVWLRTAGSEYYRRIFRRVINRYPHFIRHLGDAERLRRYSSGFLALPEDGFDTSQMRDSLADHYDVGYLACAIDALDGVEIDEYRASFIEFADKYINSLYSFCKKSIVRQTGSPIETRDLFAIFASGGYARAQAFDDDYDLILVLNSDDPSIFSFFRKLSAMMHRELVRRGTLPQYRFGDHFGEFVTRFSQLREWFESGKADTIDKTQILGSRMLVGNSRFLGQYRSEIIERFIFSHYDDFVTNMGREIEARHRHSDAGSEAGINIKEGPGGLRDIEQVLLLLKARYRVFEPISGKLFNDLAVYDEPHKGPIEQLKAHHSFLRQVRDLYRLSEAAHDDMGVDELGLVGKIMGVQNEEGEGDSGRLAHMVEEHMQKTREIVRVMVHDLAGFKLDT